MEEGERFRVYRTKPLGGFLDLKEGPVLIVDNEHRSVKNPDWRLVYSGTDKSPEGTLIFYPGEAVEGHTKEHRVVKTGPYIVKKIAALFPEQYQGLVDSHNQVVAEFMRRRTGIDKMHSETYERAEEDHRKRIADLDTLKRSSWSRIGPVENFEDILP
ncbi:hypothetical protein CMI45_01395 [Candidatus Pacearchaeota archaeon]|nr:hypothetical protein [Candidatus Pacearchaeota archaeon]|tara:strand:+ start:4159 stop:4632 length:474 start_codon:yes stop_codon:yes gene_type:complete